MGRQNSATREVEYEMMEETVVKSAGVCEEGAWDSDQETRRVSIGRE